MTAQAIEDELARRPRWLIQTLGPQPEDLDVRERWRQTARSIARHRIHERITDPSTAVSVRSQDRALERAITDTRAALGFGRYARDHDIGFEY